MLRVFNGNYLDSVEGTAGQLPRVIRIRDSHYRDGFLTGFLFLDTRLQLRTSTVPGEPFSAVYIALSSE
ncbi:hypothetical protein NXS19_003703 [Fusarium pseudograminearum]|nr:hypothetical protein NXS19_003703 [Fusarium pseudograminearum]